MPASGISFEEAVGYRKRQGFNSVSFIAAFPNWAADSHGATFANSNRTRMKPTGNTEHRTVAPIHSCNSLLTENQDWLD